ncbi:hypothetical protein [uncultured Paracoccus sp.]|uniref:hypothetical protein n=1 Tax=uncultured Paracoccus sp. TaxID=189685 RepID=UPI002611D65F|nr:hypothetical protein [uncultured Paracoccus sp.]
MVDFGLSLWPKIVSILLAGGGPGYMIAETNCAPGYQPPFVVCCLSNDPEILNRNLRASPAIVSGRLKLDVEENPPSATIGYNRLLDRNPDAVCILAHHDVYLPEGWDQVLTDRLAEVEALDQNWGIVAAYGVGSDGRHWGPVWCSALSSVIGGVALQPEPIMSADELLIILRPGMGLRFDEKLPHFHFYGLDIVQTARMAGLGVYNVPLPLVHNDRFSKDLGEGYRDSYDYMHRKWRAQLPLRATTTTISWHKLHLYRSLRNMAAYAETGAARAAPVSVAPESYAERCGWSRLG